MPQKFLSAFECSHINATISGIKYNRIMRGQIQCKENYSHISNLDYFACNFKKIIIMFSLTSTILWSSTEHFCCFALLLSFFSGKELSNSLFFQYTAQEDICMRIQQLHKTGSGSLNYFKNNNLLFPSVLLLAEGITVWFSSKLTYFSQYCIDLILWEKNKKKKGEKKEKNRKRLLLYSYIEGKINCHGIRW